MQQLIPNRRELRMALPRHVHATRYAPAVALLVRFVAIYAAGMALVIAPPGGHWAWRAIGVATLGIMAAKLFEIGHEAMHLSFTGSKRVDRVIALVTLLPTLQPLGPAIYGHVSRHHRYTNVRNHDVQWTPLAKAEYDALGPLRRALERLYRSGFGFGLYWFVEVIGKQLFAPRGMVLSEAIQPPQTSRRTFARDRMLVIGYALANVAGWTLAAPALGLPAWLAVTCGFVIPTVIAHWLIGAITYFQHTAEAIRWHASTASCSFFEAQVAGTEELVAPNPIMGLLVSNLRPHTAHHVDITIPAYKLRAAQDAIDAKFPGVAPKQTLTWRVFRRTLARCKLYDYDAQRWLDFTGRPTSR